MQSNLTYRYPASPSSRTLEALNELASLAILTIRDPENISIKY